MCSFLGNLAVEAHFNGLWSGLCPASNLWQEKSKQIQYCHQLSNGLLQCSSHTIACFSSLRDTSWQIHQHQILILFSREWVQRRRRNYLLNLLAGKMGLSQGHWSPTLFLLFVQIEEDEPSQSPMMVHFYLQTGLLNRNYFLFFAHLSRKKQLILMKL